MVTNTSADVGRKRGADGMWACGVLYGDPGECQGIFFIRKKKEKRKIDFGTW